MNTNNSPEYMGPEIEPTEDLSVAEKLNQEMDSERIKLRDAFVRLSMVGTLTVADTYSTEEMGVEFSTERGEQIQAERDRLNQTLGDVSRQWAELNGTLSELQRGVGSIQYLIDPENN
ncbi:MAG: hypothetical protein M9934_07175 [Thermomicrobiales bacterium]|nr:hypothetical protein [Thermomicrobiales bacterium]MCO5218683.1 hypothetical protein [Thermomicrobiales bacterium]MCO5228052.1 hypothetical protein [Thermomicrobiales bacterium]